MYIEKSNLISCFQKWIEGLKTKILSAKIVLQ